MNIVVVLSRFGTLKVQSFILIEVSDCSLLIVVTSSTFLKRKDMFKEKNSQPRSSKPTAQHELRLLLLLLTKKYCSSFVWNSQGAVFYAHRSERL